MKRHHKEKMVTAEQFKYKNVALELYIVLSYSILFYLNLEYYNIYCH